MNPIPHLMIIMTSLLHPSRRPSVKKPEAGLGLVAAQGCFNLTHTSRPVQRSFLKSTAKKKFTPHYQ
jgi:hypothetical protein